MIDVKQLRKKLGLTQEELARKLDVAVLTIRRWEKSQKRLHSSNRKRLERLAKRADITINEEE